MAIGHTTSAELVHNTRTWWLCCLVCGWFGSALYVLVLLVSWGKVAGDTENSVSIECVTKSLWEVDPYLGSERPLAAENLLREVATCTREVTDTGFVGDLMSSP